MPIHVHGFASSIGPKKATIGGPAALFQDFRPTFHFVTQDEIIASKKPRLHQTIAHDDDDPSCLHERPHESAAKESAARVHDVAGNGNLHLTFQVQDEHATRGHHREKYNQLLTTFRHERQAQSRLHHMTTQGKDLMVNIGMAPQSGLRAPEMKVPVATEPLWIEPNDGHHRKSNVMSSSFDGTKTIEKKFKPVPVTQAEIKDCHVALTREQLTTSLLCGPTTLDFGQVCVNSVSKKSFCVANALPHGVLVALRLRSDDDRSHHEGGRMLNEDLAELQGTTPLSQVIPSGAMAGFDITFQSRVAQVFQKHLTYTVNGKHTFKMLVIADVVPIHVELSTPVLEFSFDAQDVAMNVSRQLTLKNPGTADARFTWVPEAIGHQHLERQRRQDKSALPTATTAITTSSRTYDDDARTCAFDVTPAHGVIPPGQTFAVQISFCPRYAVPNQATMHVVVDGGTLCTHTQEGLDGRHVRQIHI